MRCVRAIALGALLAGFPLGSLAVGEPVLVHDTFDDENVMSNRNRLLNEGVPQYADPFVVTGDDYVLDTIEIGLFTSGLVDLTVRLWDDAGNVPGTVLESWTVPILFPAPDCSPLPCGNDVLVESVVQPTLLDGEQYWLSVAAVGVSWRKADLNALGTNPGPLLSNDILFAATAGEPTEWFEVPDEEINMVILPGAFFGVAAVSAIPAPEPAALLAQAAALAAVGFLARGRAGARR